MGDGCEGAFDGLDAGGPEREGTACDAATICGCAIMERE